MNQTLVAIADSITFMEDQLEALGTFPYCEPDIDESEIREIGSLTMRLVRLRRVTDTRRMLEEMQYQSVADCFHRMLGGELSLIAIHKPIATAGSSENQLSLFAEDLRASPNAA